MDFSHCNAPLKARGVEKLNPIEALEKLKTDGYTHVLIQSTNIIEGIEMESLRKDVATMKSSFKEIRIGNPYCIHRRIMRR